MAKTTLSGATERHNGGTVIMAGNVGSTSKTKNLSIIASLHKTVYASKANEDNANAGLADRPLANGDYAKMTKSRFIAKYLTGGYIAGIENSSINQMARDPSMKTTHKNETARRLHITSWNAVTGAATKGANHGNSYNFINPEVSGGATASSESGTPNNEWSVNGELVFMTGGKNPTTTSYSVRKG